MPANTHPLINVLILFHFIQHKEGKIAGVDLILRDEGDKKRRDHEAGGQATWDDELAPSAWHGVTTTVMGSCGVGFAPAREADHDRLIKLMEGVDHIAAAENLQRALRRGRL